MGFKFEFKAGWKGHAGVLPSMALLEALARNEGFKKRKIRGQDKDQADSELSDLHSKR